jgi:hypothetical protein
MDDEALEGWDSQAYFQVRRKITGRRLTKFAAKIARPHMAKLVEPDQPLGLYLSEE